MPHHAEHRCCVLCYEYGLSTDRSQRSLILIRSECLVLMVCASNYVRACAQYFVLMDKRPGAPTTLGELMGKLYDIRPFGGLAVPWVMFASSGHETRPKVRI